MAHVNCSAKCESCRAIINSIFNSLQKEDFSHFSENISCFTYQKGQQVFSENGYPRGIFILNSGTIKISKNCSDGKEQILRLVKEGDVIGYRAMLSGDKYTCSATVMNNASLCFISRDTLLTLMSRNGELSLNIMKLLATDLKKAEKHITNLSHKTVRERVAEAIIILKETYGYENDNSTININLNRTEIGSFIGITRETATRTLYELMSTGIIDLKGNKISVINQMELMNIANLIN